MGVGSKADADARLAALKAEMRGEVGDMQPVLPVSSVCAVLQYL
jgi:hypothetical protein